MGGTPTTAGKIPSTSTTGEGGVLTCCCYMYSGRRAASLSPSSPPLTTWLTLSPARHLTPKIAFCRHPETRRALRDTLCWIASTGLADGVRVDMSMLCVSENVKWAWGHLNAAEAAQKLPRPGPAAPATASAPAIAASGITIADPSSRFESGTPALSKAGGEGQAQGDPLDPEFWPWALASVKAANPHFIVLGEVYWEQEAKLQALGFDFTWVITGGVCLGVLDLALHPPVATPPSSSLMK